MIIHAFKYVSEEETFDLLVLVQLLSELSNVGSVGGTLRSGLCLQHRRDGGKGISLKAIVHED